MRTFLSILICLIITVDKSSAQISACDSNAIATVREREEMRRAAASESSDHGNTPYSDGWYVGAFDTIYHYDLAVGLCVVRMTYDDWPSHSSGPREQDYIVADSGHRLFDLNPFIREEGDLKEFLHHLGDSLSDQEYTTLSKLLFKHYLETEGPVEFVDRENVERFRSICPVVKEPVVRRRDGRGHNDIGDFFEYGVVKPPRVEVFFYGVRSYRDVAPEVWIGEISFLPDDSIDVSIIPLDY